MTAPLPPSPAATIIVCRDQPGGVEVLMIQRNRTVDFASGALVFPGGKLTQDDIALEADQPFAGYRIAALRELFEETGLIAARPDPSADQCAQLLPHRAAVESGALDFAALLQNAGLAAHVEALERYTHWVTPKMSRRRYDTQFFLCPAPNGQTALSDGGEAVDAVWLRPADAVAAGDAGERTVIFPTKMVLLRLAQAQSFAELVHQAQRWPIAPIEPWVEPRGDSHHLCIPDDQGYPVISESLETALRG
jgi:8-oxo-dGTP pyrophosphatase MutT (NUDIX family)